MKESNVQAKQKLAKAITKLCMIAYTKGLGDSTSIDLMRDEDYEKTFMDGALKLIDSRVVVLPLESKDAPQAKEEALEFPCDLCKSREAVISGRKASGEDFQICQHCRDFIKRIYLDSETAAQIEPKDFMSMSDAEAKEIMTTLFSPKRIISVERNTQYREIGVTMFTVWQTEEGPIEIEDRIDLTAGGFEAPFSLSTEDRIRYQQFLVARGYHPLLQDNEFLKSEGTRDDE